MTSAGRNHVGARPFVMRQHEAISLIEHGDHANHGPLAPPFFITNTLASTFGYRALK
jgi:hypothetical protein